MTLDLDSNVVYALLAAIVAIVLIVNGMKLFWLRLTPKRDRSPVPYDQEVSTQQWPVQKP